MSGPQPPPGAAPDGPAPDGPAPDGAAPDGAAPDGPGPGVAAWAGRPEWAQVADLALHDLDGDPVRRLVLVTTRPDGRPWAGDGLLARAAAEGLRVVVVAAAPGDPRPADGESALCRRLVETVTDGRGTLVVAPWRHDGHPGHEAAGRAAAVAALRTGARLLEYPVWLWRWGTPADLPWPDVRRLSPSAGERLAGPHETYLEQAAYDSALEQVHQRAADPWGVDSRWFEERKRRLVLACLPGPRYAAAWEAGCSTGALVQALLERCDIVVGTDSSVTAVAAARERLVGEPRARVAERDVTAAWPAASYDLVVLSEVGYFLSPRDLDRFAGVVEVALRPDGVLLLCHWRHPIEGRPLDGADVSARWAARAGWSVQARYADRDVEILVLARGDVLPVSDA